jgi:hypothetical protein
LGFLAREEKRGENREEEKKQGRRGAYEVYEMWECGMETNSEGCCLVGVRRSEREIAEEEG